MRFWGSRRSSESYFWTEIHYLTKSIVNTGITLLSKCVSLESLPPPHRIQTRINTDDGASPRVRKESSNWKSAVQFGAVGS